MVPCASEISPESEIAVSRYELGPFTAAARSREIFWRSTAVCGVNVNVNQWVRSIEAVSHPFAEAAAPGLPEPFE